MPQVTIENPILNSPFEAPGRHFRFDNEGITTDIDEKRRASAFFMPIARARKKGEQAHFDTEWTADRIKPNTEINRIRERVDRWRQGGYLTVHLNGVDVYDPTTGQIRSSTTDDVACWFIDTDYDGQSFFVRDAYFTGADEPYDKVKRALRADIDESAWSTLYSTTSRPFAPPETGKIAVKVINHYGDEVLKVYEV